MTHKEEQPVGVFVPFGFSGPPHKFVLLLKLEEMDIPLITLNTVKESTLEGLSLVTPASLLLPCGTGTVLGPWKRLWDRCGFLAHLSNRKVLSAI